MMQNVERDRYGQRKKCRIHLCININLLSSFFFSPALLLSGVLEQYIIVFHGLLLNFGLLCSFPAQYLYSGTALE